MTSLSKNKKPESKIYQELLHQKVILIKLRKFMETGGDQNLKIVNNKLMKLLNYKDSLGKELVSDSKINHKYKLKKNSKIRLLNI